MLGAPVLEPVASIVICVFIAKAAFDIFMDAVNRLIDSSCPDEEAERMRKVISAIEGVKKIDMLRTRRFGSRVYVDVEIAEDADLNLVSAHAVAETVHKKIEETFPDVKHCMVHVNPYLQDV